MNRSNRVVETKALISFVVTASLFLHMQKNGNPIIFLKFENKKNCNTILDRDHFST